MMKNTIFLGIFLWWPLWLSAQTERVLESPNRALQARISIGQQEARIQLQEQGKGLVEIRTLQLELKEQPAMGNWQVVDETRKSVRQTWQPVYGERSQVVDCYDEMCLRLQSRDSQKEMGLTLRMYDEGLAFRYSFDRLDFWNCTLTNERTQFLFPSDADTWVTGQAQGAYAPTKLSALQGIADRPQVVCTGTVFLAVGEAALVDYARMKLGKSDTGWGIQSVLSGEVNLDMAGYQSPWRYVMVAKQPGQLVQNNDFILNLNEPNAIADTRWIRPGKVLREVTLTTAGALAAVDFASDHHIEYIEFDAGWYGPEEDTASDATTVTVDPARSAGPLDMEQIIRYADQKGIGIIVYVNKKALHQQLDDILPLYQQWGIKGIKFGFVNVGDQYSTAWLHQAVRKAAKYQLMVDIHDEYRPTGYSRTYPNLMTQEGIRGDEESPALEQTIYTLYNRMIGGAGDYTNCLFAPRVTEKMGGRAAQLAKRVAVYSPWQFVFWYDRPAAAPARAGGAGSTASVIQTGDLTDFYCSIPVVWDDSRFLDGQMGQYAVVARRSASDWYVSVLNAGDARTVTIPLDFLDRYPAYEEAVMYDQPDEKKKDTVRRKVLSLKGKKELVLQVVRNSGCVIRLTPKCQ